MGRTGRVVDAVTIEQYGPRGRSAWLDVDWSAHQRWVAVDGRAVNVVDLGEGPAVVFVHGLSGSWQNWLENLPDLARDHRVLALDLPGFGESAPPAAGISIPGYVATVAAVLDALGVRQADVVGNSMGGLVAAELALAMPERVRRLALVSPAGISADGLIGDRAMVALRRAERLIVGYNRFWADRADRVSRRAGLRRQLLRASAAHPELLPAALASEQLRVSGRPAFLDALEAIVRTSIRARLPGVGCPALLVWGERDRLVPVADAARFARAIPDSQLIVYADTGHVAMLERPERFNADLRAFLAD
ncbi:alpha/beta hydrolase [Paraconexibacter algicola]|uniref:Alpha/beta hydrolase n=1 Tax=Paraconexibacter algicola TaxID=2133960 RepID=A0A2T4UD06_9ACTN|nr:alpha/beta fold hydrolase [Paraconexibacter algicola]PTL55386.1 alpha/beta hydrolase [Paraconexibacter algicola]